MASLFSTNALEKTCLVKSITIDVIAHLSLVSFHLGELLINRNDVLKCLLDSRIRNRFTWQTSPIRHLFLGNLLLAAGPRVRTCHRVLC